MGNSLLAQLTRDRQDLTVLGFAPGGISHCQDLFLTATGWQWGLKLNKAQLSPFQKKTWRWCKMFWPKSVEFLICTSDLLQLFF